MKKGILRELKKNKILFIMFIPAMLYFVLFEYLPMPGVIVAFKNYNYNDGIFLSPWLGLNNFKFFFISGRALNVTLNTILYNLVFLTVNNFLQITTAIILADLVGNKFKKICQSITFLPYFISWVVIAAFAYNLLNYEVGALNNLIKSLGHEPLDFYNTGWYWYILLPLFSAWKHLGYGTVVYFAAIMGIDRECYEAVEIDGANLFQRIRYVTLPFLVPTLITLVLLRLGRILRGDFEMFYQLIGQSSLLFKNTDVIDTFVFRSLVKSTDIGMASAAGFYQSIIGFVIIMAVNSIIRKYKSEYALF